MNFVVVRNIGLQFIIPKLETVNGKCSIGVNQNDVLDDPNIHHSVVLDRNRVYWIKQFSLRKGSPSIFLPSMMPVDVFDPLNWRRPVHFGGRTNIDAFVSYTSINQLLRGIGSGFYYSFCLWSIFVEFTVKMCIANKVSYENRKSKHFLTDAFVEV